MINLKQIENRIYEDKELMGFTFKLVFDDNKVQEFNFRRLDKLSTAWILQTLINKTQIRDTQVYSIIYQAPSKTVPIVMVAATGLRYYKLALEEELQNKSMMDFALGEAISNM